MPSTFDLSNQGNQPLPQHGRNSSNQDAPRGTGTPVDDYARYIFYIAAIAFALSLGYLLWGLFSGSWCNPDYEKLDHIGRLKQLDNIALFYKILGIASWVGVLTLVVFSFRDEALGYILIGLGAMFYLGFPYLYSSIFDGTDRKPSPATTTVLGDLQGLVWAFALPGVALIIVDFINRFRDASENAAIQRANIKYGANVAEQAPTKAQRQVFLGSCWQLSYCRDNVRVKCPIFLEKKGPCWWRKRGCMCDERIVLQAVISSDWKEQTKTAGSTTRLPEEGYQLKAGASAILSEAAKRERCRGCVIYNEHQRQKYKAMVTVVLLAVPLIYLLAAAQVQAAVVKLIGTAEHVTQRLSFSGSSPIAQAPPSDWVQWSIIICLTLVVLAQVLKFIEWWCFKIKI